MFRRLLVFAWVLFGWVGFVAAQQNPDGRLPLANLPEPLVILIRDPVVQDTLQLSKTQRKKVGTLCDQWDGELWKTRNQPPDQVAEMMSRLTKTAESDLANLLDRKQQQRLSQIRLWIRGVKALADPAVVRELKLAESQVAEVKATIESVGKAVGQLQQQASEGTDLSKLQKQSDELNQKLQQDLAKILTDEQKQQWRRLVGDPLDAKKLGYVDFLAPELPSLDHWINSSPLSKSDLEGKVVVLHFFAFGCINCIHNYPSYRRWQEQFRSQPVLMLGVHTPETEQERSFADLKKRVATEKLDFPIVMDSESAVWNAWGNSMWPSVYLIDKRGRVRYWWLGELNWQGAKGEEILGKRIQQLVDEPYVAEK